MKTPWAGRLLGTLTLLCARVAYAAPERFGEQGQLVIDQSFSLSASHTFFTNNDNFRYTTNSFTLAPSASYFVVPQVSLGLRAMVGRSIATTHDNNSVKLSERAGGAVSVGYVLNLGDHFALWPTVAGEYSHIWTTPFETAGGADHGDNVSAIAQTPFLWLPATHFFVGVGPRVDVIWNGDELGQLEGPRIAIGALTQIGGYFEP